MSILTNTLTDAAPVALKAMLRHAATGLADVNLVRADDWELQDDASGGLELKSIGEIRTEPFTTETQLEAFKWLAAADWLDSSPPDWENLRNTVVTLGALSLAPDQVTVTFGPGGLLADGRVAPPPVMDWASGKDHPEVARHLPAGALWLHLWELRKTLELLAGKEAGIPDWREQLLHGPRTFQALPPLLSRLEEDGFADGTDQVTLALQAWFLLQLWEDPPRLELVVGREGLQPYAHPTSPMQRMWLTLAATAGVLPPPFSTSGIAQCGYPPCSQWFERTGKRRRFCSDRCGKSFYAARSTRQRREREKAARTNGGDRTDAD